MPVSVIIPAYNAEQWIAETINSVLKQTYQDVDIVLVDDGSTDSTVEVAEQALRRGRLSYRVLNQSNKGAAEARNRGWQSARAQWVQFLDADDLLEPRKIELQIAQVLTRRPVDVVYSDWQKLVWSGGVWRGEDEIRTPVIGPNALADILSERHFLQLSSLMFKTSTLDIVGGFDKSHEPIEDVGLCVKIAMAGGVFLRAESSGPMSWYRDRPSSLSKSNQERFIESCIKNAKLAEQYVDNDPNYSSQIDQAIVDIYYSGARYFAGRDWERFEEIVADIERLQPIFVPKVPAPLKLLSRIAGYRWAERLAVFYRTGKLIGTDLWDTYGTIRRKAQPDHKSRR
jgi:glycosyltransferase involved in cell wall biosynthesis